MKIKNKKKTIIIGLSIILGIFAIWNILWLVHFNNYKGFIKNIKDDGSGVYVVGDEDENSYSVKMPNYLMFNGNLAVIDKDNHALIVWVSLFGKETYGTRMVRENETYEMILDKDMQLTGDGNRSDAQDVLTEYKSEIAQLYNNAFKFWDLDK